MQKSEALIETMSRLISNQPFFAVYLMDQMEIAESDQIPTAGTDGRRILFNPAFLEKMTPQQREFVLCHEVLHGIYQHMPRSKLYTDRGLGPDLKPFSAKKFNYAADYIINATLSECNIGTMPLGGLFHPDIGAADLADEVYLQLPDEEDDEEGDGNDGIDGDEPSDQYGGKGKPFDQHMQPDPNRRQPSEAETKRALQSAKNAATAQGKMPGALERLVDSILDPKVPWEDVLRSEMTAMAGRDTATWQRANRRRLAMAPHVYMPGTTGFQTGGVCVVVDTSGSISDSMVQRFLSEVSGILIECKPEWCKVLWTDTNVAHVDEIDDPEELNELTAHGGGGTDMEAAFTYIDENDYCPDHVVVLTDGYTTFSKEGPAFPVIWGITTEVVAPYGKTIHVE